MNFAFEISGMPLSLFVSGHSTYWHSRDCKCNLSIPIPYNSNDCLTRVNIAASLQKACSPHLHQRKHSNAVGKFLVRIYLRATVAVDAGCQATSAATSTRLLFATSICIYCKINDEKIDCDSLPFHFSIPGVCENIVSVCRVRTDSAVRAETMCRAIINRLHIFRSGQ